MALRSDRHRIRPIAALALDAGTTIGPRCATIHVGQGAERLRSQAGYTTAAETKGTSTVTRLPSGRSPYTPASTSDGVEFQRKISRTESLPATRCGFP